MYSSKLLLTAIFIISAFIIICEGFKLHLNREEKDKQDLQTDHVDKIHKRFKFSKSHEEKILYKENDDSQEVNEVSEDIDDHINKIKDKIEKDEKPLKQLFYNSGEDDDSDEEIDQEVFVTKPSIKHQRVEIKIHKEEKEVKKVELKKVIKNDEKIEEKYESKPEIKKEAIAAKQNITKSVDKHSTKSISNKTEKLETKPKIETDKQKIKENPILTNKTSNAKLDKDVKLHKDAKKSFKDSKKPEEKAISNKNVGSSKPKPEAHDQPKASDKSNEKTASEKLNFSKQLNINEPESETESNSEQEQFDVLYRSLPSFAPNYNIVKNEKCQREGQIFLRQLRGHKLWALQMLDASAKLPSGILRGNLNQLGDFDACLDAFARVKVHQDKPAVPVKGKYCLAEIDFAAVAEGARYPVHLLQARSFIRSNRKDAGHFIPKFTTINWAICVPSACTYQDAEDMLLEAIAPYNMTTGVKITLDVREDMCYTKKHVEWWKHSYETLATLGFYIFVVTIACAATLKDCWQSKTDVAQSEEQPEICDGSRVVPNQKDGVLHKMLMSFSIKRSCEELLKNEASEGDIQCIHGIRALTTLILYSAHKLLPLARIPFSNRTFLTEIANSQWSVFLRVSLIYTDTFLLLSGVLSSYNMSRDMMTKGEISWFKRLLTRYIRLTPALAAVLLFYAYIWDHLGTGPQWSNVVTANAQLCKKNMWTNLLYIQNFFPFEDMCATHTHQLALDMQLTILAPILVWFLYKAPLWGLALLGGFHSLSVGLRYFSTINHRLSLVIFHGMSHSQLMRTANLSYANALHRATPYLTGVGLGVMLKNTEKHIQLPKVILALGWMGAFYFFGWTFNTPAHLSKRDYQYDVAEAAQFSASASVAWALALSWLIFACHTNNGGSINNFLCSRPLILLSRISYAIYLVQFIIFFYNVGTFRSSTVFDVTQSFNVLEFISVIIASIMITLLFDTPMQAIKNIIIKKSYIHELTQKDELIKEQETVEYESGEQIIHSENRQEYDDHYHGHTYDSENTYERQESQDSQDGYPVSEKYQSSENDPISERDPNSEGGYGPEHDLVEYEYDDEIQGEDETEPTTEKELDHDDQDLKDWEWTENDKQQEES